MTTPSASPLELRAGSLTAAFYPDELFLRYVHVGSEECLRGVYLAIRDKDWNTPAPMVGVKSSDIGDRSFELVLDAHWKHADIQYRAECRLIGSEAGRMEYRFKGSSESEFLRNRLGFVVLHGAQLAGEKVLVESVDGAMEETTFPENISPHQPFFDVRAMTHVISNGTEVKVLMEGDTFETEDQRNWTDASYKTYCTPLGLPFPVKLRVGDEVEQSITIITQGADASAPRDEAASPIDLYMDDAAKSYPIPLIGLETAVNLKSGELNGAALENVISLKPDHLRVSLLISDPGALDRLAQAQDEALEIGCALEVALFTRVGDNLAGLFRQVKERLEAPVVRWLVFDPDTKATPPAATAAIRDALAGAELAGPVGAGTDHFFTELNRDCSAVEGADVVSFSMNPQVHAFDDLSLVETLEMQGVCVKSARSFSGDRPIVVSPLTFKMRSNPNATGGEDASVDVSARIDLRQQQLFGAIWTLGSLLYLTEAEAHAVTLYELLGPLGIMDPSGDRYPLYEAIATFTRFKGGTLKPMMSMDPLKAIGCELVSADRDERLAVLANLSSESQVLRYKLSEYELQPYQYKTWKL